MKVELRINGSLILRMQPETDIERLVLTEMAAGAERGKKVLLADAQDEWYSVAVEK